ncbi:site-specific DNA-methyltransferase [Arundinibacter roseus]|uniref:site-specific DNA-methyltransferase (adenine-specific) n=1 Tax=Arundinibacter roseus TaxID=2070510 RepID=A0A4R4KC81_9BACT|nr:site-specific DNA-methyltransferase [Arundinibacter roseus]TDB64362.1 site-specific DNA-methyltransferase [Arundinibacter roseus]
MPTLHWIGKDKVVNHHLDVPYRVLNHEYGFSGDSGKTRTPTQSGNKIIHGDNLEALKALLPEYEGKVNCIYIDPPYNTGNEGWVYNDNVNDPKIKKWLATVVGKEGEDLTRHDKWLCMMYPRLMLLSKLLSQDGRMVISIGYQEVFNLIQICNEIFAKKQIVCITIQTSGGKPAGGFNFQHEYLIFIVPYDFKPNPLLFTGGKLRTPFEGLTLATFDKTQRPNQTYPIFINTDNGTLAGIGESLHERIKTGEYIDKPENFPFDYNEAPEGTVAIWPTTSKGKDCVWRLSPARLLKDWEKGYIKISKNRSKKSQNKYSIQYLPDGVIKKIESGKLEVNGKEPAAPTLTFGSNLTVGSEIPTLWQEKDFYTVKGTTQLSQIFSKKLFNYPKPLELITEILRSISSLDDIILDSFAGSGTTGNATLKLNLEDSGTRNFILIEMEEYAETTTAERVKRVINGYGEGEKAVEGTGGIFDYYTLGEPLFDEYDNLNESVGTERIRQYVWYSETRTAYESQAAGEYLLGKKDECAYYFFYEPDAMTELNFDFLALVKVKADQYVIYADNCLLSEEFMLAKNIIFKKIPRDITRF